VDQTPEHAEVARLQQSSNIHNTLQFLKKVLITPNMAENYRSVGSISVDEIFGQSVVVARKDHHSLQQNIASKLLIVTEKYYNYKSFEIYLLFRIQLVELQRSQQNVLVVVVFADHGGDTFLEFGNMIRIVAIHTLDSVLQLGFQLLKLRHFVLALKMENSAKGTRKSHRKTKMRRSFTQLIWLSMRMFLALLNLWEGSFLC
jgi:hypothetical protein